MARCMYLHISEKSITKSVETIDGLFIFGECAAREMSRKLLVRVYRARRQIQASDKADAVRDRTTRIEAM